MTVPMMALTATASLKVRNDINNSLKLRNPLKLYGGFDRPNIRYEARQRADLRPLALVALR